MMAEPVKDRQLLQPLFFAVQARWSSWLINSRWLWCRAHLQRKRLVQLLHLRIKCSNDRAPASAPGVLEQVVDCSGGEEISEESGSKRKAAALLQVLREQVNSLCSPSM